MKDYEELIDSSRVPTQFSTRNSSTNILA